jgi:acetate---CoA ligase (ADP-forming) subunit beta
MNTPAEIIAAALNEGRSALLEHEAKEFARSAGIMVPRFEVVGPDDLQAITAAAEKLGFPVALKAVSADILHKTDAGAVMLNIANSAALAASIPTMKNMIAARVPGAVIRFFLLEKMMPAGLELLIGGLRDAQFGPSVAFGLGGVWVEALQDAVFGILPMTRQEQLDMIAETKAAAFIQGFRGSPPLDQEAALAAINAVSSLLANHPEIGEIDLNPVRLYARGAVALDTRIVLRR